MSTAFMIYTPLFLACCFLFYTPPPPPLTSPKQKSTRPYSPFSNPLFPLFSLRCSLAITWYVVVLQLSKINIKLRTAKIPHSIPTTPIIYLSISSHISPLHLPPAPDSRTHNASLVSSMKHIAKSVLHNCTRASPVRDNAVADRKSVPFTVDAS